MGGEGVSAVKRGVILSTAAAKIGDFGHGPKQRRFGSTCSAYHVVPSTPDHTGRVRGPRSGSHAALSASATANRQDSNHRARQSALTASKPLQLVCLAGAPRLAWLRRAHSLLHGRIGHRSCLVHRGHLWQTAAAAEQLTGAFSTASGCTRPVHQELAR